MARTVFVSQCSTTAQREESRLRLTTRPPPWRFNRFNYGAYRASCVDRGPGSCALPLCELVSRPFCSSPTVVAKGPALLSFGGQSVGVVGDRLSGVRHG